jgi:hypothetical protein
VDEYRVIWTDGMDAVAFGGDWGGLLGCSFEKMVWSFSF